MSCLAEAVGVLHLGGTCSCERQRSPTVTKSHGGGVGAKIGHSKLYLSRWHTLRTLLQLKMRSHPLNVLSPFERTSSSTVVAPPTPPACLPAWLSSTYHDLLINTTSGTGTSMAKNSVLQNGATDNKTFPRVSFKNEGATVIEPVELPPANGSSIEILHDHDHDQTKRKLKPRHIQLIGIAGTIGTA